MMGEQLYFKSMLMQTSTLYIIEVLIWSLTNVKDLFLVTVNLHFGRMECTLLEG